MADLTIHGIPEDLYERLKMRAQRGRRGLDAEAIACLESALRGEKEKASAQHLRTAADRIQERNPDLWLTDDDLRQAITEGRP